MRERLPAGGEAAVLAMPARRRLAARPAERGEIRRIAAILRETIASHPSYSEAHRAHEMHTMRAVRLDEIWRADARNILVGTVDGAFAAFCIVEPENGVGWMRWGVALPDMRRSGIAAYVLGEMARVARERGMTKLTSVTRTDNRAVNALMKQKRFRVLCELNAHWFGEDFLMWELMLDPPVTRFDSGSTPGLAARVAIRLRHAALGAFQSRR